MKHLSLEKLAEIVISKRKSMKLSQAATAEKTGMNRSLLSRLEQQEYTPSVDQLLGLAEVLEFDHRDVFVDDTAEVKAVGRKKIAVAGTGYVGLSLAVLLSQHNDVTAVDIVPEKVEKLNNWLSPIQDDYIEQYLAEHEERQLSLRATTDGEVKTWSDLPVYTADGTDGNKKIRYTVKETAVPGYTTSYDPAKGVEIDTPVAIV